MKTKRITASDVAQAAGVSRSTVSFVLNDTPGQTISPDVRDRVRAVAERLGYVPHAHARALASGESRLILVLLPDWPLEHLTRQMLDGASAVLDEAGYSLVSMDSRRSGHTAPLWETLHPDVVMPFQPLAPVLADAIRRSGTRLVALDDKDEHAYGIGPELQIQHLVDMGHEVIAYASTPVPGFRAMDQGRLRRTRTAAERAGLRFISGVVDDEAGFDVVRGWIAGGVTGVVAFNDESAARVIRSALRQGFGVPGDLAVIGHDDWPVARLMVPSLTTISIDAGALGHYFADRALSVARGGVELPFAPPDLQARLVRREST